MKPSEKQINNMIPDATNRKRVRDYTYQDYYGYDLPDNQEFTEDTRISLAWVIAIDIVLIAGIIAIVKYCAER